MDKNKLMSDFCGLLSIASVKGEPSKNAPFGEEVAKALKYTLELAKSFGFKTINYDGFVGEVIFGEGKPFGILCHLDVVPTGNPAAWISPPFTPTVRDGNLYCRGVLDDKCGAICSLFAMKELKDNGFTPTREIHLILGCDEESGWGCIDHYKQVATLPEEGISPDADFPVIYAEKGIVHAKFRFEKLKKFNLTGGTRANVVCDECTLLTYAENDYALAEKCSLKTTGENEFKAFGVAAHGSTPEKGVNALAFAVKYLCSLGYLPEKAYTDLFADGQNFKNVRDETGYLTFSPNLAECDDKYLYVTVDVRYPSTLEYGYVEKLLLAVAPFEVEHYQAPLFVDKNSRLVTTLLKVYNDVTGENAKPIAIGGGTYARALKSAVAFGPSFGAEGDSIHQPNEYMPVENIYKFTEILYRALKELCC